MKGKRAITPHAAVLQQCPCNIPALGVDDEVTGSVFVQALQQGALEFTASVPDTGDSDPDNNSASFTITVQAGADLVLTIDGPADAPAGSVETYSFTVENLGPDPASNFTVEFPVPTGLSNVTPPTGCTLSGGTYSCQIPGPLAVGETVSLDFTGQVVGTVGSTGLSCSTAAVSSTARRLTCMIDALPICTGNDCPEITVQVRPGGNVDYATTPLDRSAHRAEKRRCRAGMMRVHRMIRSAPGVRATADAARGGKRLSSGQNQAILTSDGRPFGECRENHDLRARRN